MRNVFVVSSIVAVLLVALLGAWWTPALASYLLVLPAVALGVHDMRQKEHSLRRNFPLVSRGRWFMEWLRPYFRQYFFESETDGAPVSRMFRSVVYQRAKGQGDTVPFGTKMNTYGEGYEWMAHSMAAIDTHGTVTDPRVTVGGRDCTEPYSASLLNVSAMSFGSLSANAVLALNSGARKGGFAQNTGEGGLSKHHLEHGGDLVWQIGTGLLRLPRRGRRLRRGQVRRERPPARGADDRDQALPRRQARSRRHPARDQEHRRDRRGARGSSPAPWSPPRLRTRPSPHTLELMAFVARLRELSGGKPVGFKLCVGRESEFVAICKAMIETDTPPGLHHRRRRRGRVPAPHRSSSPIRSACRFATVSPSSATACRGSG